MDNSITQNLENKKRYLPHDLNTKIHAVEITEISNIHVENIIFLDILYGDGIKNMMERQRA